VTPRERDLLSLVAAWIAERDATFAAAKAELNEKHKRCYLYPACRKGGKCDEHMTEEP
jgi:hypothetical protein